MNLPFFFVSSGIVHENPRITSDGESEEISGTSSEREDVVSPVKLRQRQRRYSQVSAFIGLSIISLR